MASAYIRSEKTPRPIPIPAVRPGSLGVYVESTHYSENRQ